MKRINKKQQVNYSANEMYRLVNDIESYPEFLPWCTAAKILEQEELALVASVSIAIGKIRQSFTTANRMQADEVINMQLVEGPFKKLVGDWQFQAINEKECVVSLDMQFEFKNKILKHTLGHAFNKIVDSLVDAFVSRAQTVYGLR
ncbi:MAG: type II toxin-antitoxin system RatA family toxin [Pseudomonadota bacterium]